jgi:putative ABC transport system substrate-binding protein
MRSCCDSREADVELINRAVPASYGSRPYAEISGLMSYGTNLTDRFRQVGVYTGRVLKGAKSTDLPVVQASIRVGHQSANGKIAGP